MILDMTLDPEEVRDLIKSGYHRWDSTTVLSLLDEIDRLRASLVDERVATLAYLRSPEWITSDIADSVIRGMLRVLADAIERGAHLPKEGA